MRTGGFLVSSSSLLQPVLAYGPQPVDKPLPIFERLSLDLASLQALPHFSAALDAGHLKETVYSHCCVSAAPGAGERAQQLRMWTTPAEHPSSFPSIHTAAQNHLGPASRGPSTLFWSSQALHRCTYTIENKKKISVYSAKKT